MKFSVTLKDPDGFSESVQEAVKENVARMPDLGEEERESVEEIRTEAVNKFLEKWIEYSEYVTIEFDTVAGTATVMPRE